MRPDPDDRSDPILAVFDSPERARRAVRRLSQVVADAARVEALPLAPGRYKLADISRAQEVYAAVRGAAVGAPLGGLVGLALGATLVGVASFPALGATAAGALAGLAVGGFRGIARTYWTDNGHEFLDVPPYNEYVLVAVPAGAIADRRQRARAMRALLRAGALGFLEPSAYPAATVGPRSGSPPM